MAAETRSKVFVSYSRADLEFADELVEGLELDGRFEVSIDRHAIGAGEDWRKRLGALIQAADTVVFVISPDSISSGICEWEVEESRRLSKRVIPVVWRPIDFGDAPYGLSALNAIPFNGVHAVSGAHRLIEALLSDLGWLRAHTRLSERSIEWDAAGRGTARLMRGAALKEAQDWLAVKPQNAPELTTLQRDYLQASEEEETRLLSAERQRLEEIVEAQKAAEQAERERAEAASGFARRLRRLLVVVSVLALAALGAFGYAIWLADEREEARLELADAIDKAEIAQRAAEEASASAKERAKAAIEASELAEANLERANLTEGRFLTRFAELARADGDIGDAIALAHVAARRLTGMEEREERARAIRVLAEALDERRELGVLRENIGPAPAVAISADGGAAAAIWLDESEGAATLVVSSTRIDDSELQVGARRKMDAPTAGALAISPNGRRVALGDSDGGVWLWTDGADESEPNLIGFHGNAVTDAAFAPSGESFATVSLDGVVKLWSVAGAEIDAYSAPAVDRQEELRSIEFSPDGERLLIGGAVTSAETGQLHGFARILRLADGGVERQFGSTERRQHRAPVTAAAFVRDGLYIVTGSEDRTARVWSVADGEDLFTFTEHDKPITDVVGLPGSTLVATASRDRTIRLWDVETGAEADVLAGHDADVLDLALSADGDVLISGSADRSARFWRLSASADVEIIAEFGDDFEDAYFGSGGAVLLTHSFSNEVRLWRRDGASMVLAPIEAGRWASAAAVSADGAYVAIAETDASEYSVRVRDTRNEKSVRTFHSGEINVSSLAFSADGARLAAGLGDGRILVWERDTGRELVRLGGQGGLVQSLAFGPSGRALAAGGGDGTMRIWDLANQRERGVGGEKSRGWGPATAGLGAAAQEKHSAPVRVVTFSANGSLVASGSDDLTIGVWDAATGRLRRRIGEEVGAHTSSIWSLDFSPDRESLASASDDGTVAIWNVDSGVQQRVLRGHESGALGVAFLADGGGLASISRTGKVRTWPRRGDDSQVMAHAARLLDRLEPMTIGENCEFFLRDFDNPDEPSLCPILGSESIRTDVLPALLERAVALEREGRGSQAREAFDAAKAREGADAGEIRRLEANAKVDRAATLLGENKDTVAEQLFAAALAVDSGVAERISLLKAQTWTARGWSAYGQERLDVARTAFETALDARPGHADAYLGLGAVEWIAGRSDPAIAAFDKAIELTPDEFGAYGWKGSALVSNGRFEAALENLDRSLALGGTWYELHLLRWQALRGLRREAQSQAAWNALVAAGAAASMVGDSVRLDWRIAQADPQMALFLGLDLRRWLADRFDGALDDEGHRADLVNFAYALGSVHQRSTALDDAAATDCDRLAASEYDPLAVVADGVASSDLNAEAAVQACDRAVEEAEATGADAMVVARLRYQRARALFELGDFGRQRQDLAASMAAGYPMAFNSAGFNAWNGQGGADVEPARAARLWLETANRMVVCCAMAGVEALARPPLAGDPAAAAARIELLQWAAAYGSPPAHRALAESRRDEDPQAALGSALIAERLDGAAPSLSTEIASGLTAAQRARARAAAEEWRPLSLDADPPLLRRMIGATDLMLAFHAHVGEVLDVAFAPDGETFVTGGSDSEGRIWNAHSGALVSALSGHADWMRSVAVNPDGRLVATGSHDGTARIWDAGTGAALRVLGGNDGHTDYVRGVAFSSDGRFVATASDDLTARLWRVEDGALVRVFGDDGQGHEGWLMSVALSPDGARLLTGSVDGTARLWDVASGGEIARWSGHQGAIRSVAFSPDGGLAATASEDGSTRIWNVETFEEARLLSDEGAAQVLDLAFGPGGALLATGGGDGAARIWSLESGERIRSIRAHQTAVNAVAFSPEGDVLATAAADGSVRLWSLASRASE